MKPYPARLAIQTYIFSGCSADGLKEIAAESLSVVAHPSYRGSAAGTKEWKRYRRYIRRLRAYAKRLNEIWPSTYRDLGSFALQEVE